MIGVLLALSMYPPVMDVGAAPEQVVELPTLLVGEGPVLLHTTGPLVAEQEIFLAGKKHVTLTARIRANTLPGNHTAYLHATPKTDDALVIASTVPVRVAVHEQPHDTRIIPTTTSRGALWAALGGVFATITGLLGAFITRKA